MLHIVYSFKESVKLDILLVKSARAAALKKEFNMIRNAIESDFSAIYEVINDAAIAYKSIIPADRWHEPYMTRAELKAQIKEGVQFICSLEDEKLVGVMGIQDRGKSI